MSRKVSVLPYFIFLRQLRRPVSYLSHSFDCDLGAWHSIVLSHLSVANVEVH